MDLKISAGVGVAQLNLQDKNGGGDFSASGPILNAAVACNRYGYSGPKLIAGLSGQVGRSRAGVFGDVTAATGAHIPFNIRSADFAVDAMGLVGVGGGINDTNTSGLTPLIGASLIAQGELYRSIQVGPYASVVANPFDQGGGYSLGLVASKTF